jgi:hypothetical protein
LVADLPVVSMYRHFFIRIDLCAWRLLAWHLTSVLGCRKTGLLGSREKRWWMGIRQTKRMDSERSNS